MHGMVCCHVSQRSQLAPLLTPVSLYPSFVELEALVGFDADGTLPPSP